MHQGNINMWEGGGSGRIKVAMFVLNSMVTDARVTREAQALACAGYGVTVYAMWEPHTSLQEKKNGFSIHRIRVRTRTLPKSPPFWLLKYSEYIARAVYLSIKDGARVFHGHDMTGLVPAWLASVCARGVLVYDAHELFTEQTVVPLRPFWRVLERFFIPRADLVISAEENRGRILFEEYGAKRQPVTLINCPPYYDASGIDRKGPPMTSRWKHTVLYQGGIDPERCIEELIEGFTFVPEAAGLLLIGPIGEEYKRCLIKLAERCGLHSRIHFVNRVPFEELVSYTLNADLGVMLYRNNCRNNYYCAPNKLYEYMMAGLPAVGPAFPGVGSIIQAGQVGLTVDPGNAKEIGHAISMLIQNQGLREECRRNALRLARTRYNWDIEHSKLVAAYRELVLGNHGRKCSKGASGS